MIDRRVFWIEVRCKILKEKTMEVNEKKEYLYYIQSEIDNISGIMKSLIFANWLSVKNGMPIYLVLPSVKMFACSEIRLAF